MERHSRGFIYDGNMNNRQLQLIHVYSKGYDGIGSICETIMTDVVKAVFASKKLRQCKYLLRGNENKHYLFFSTEMDKKLKDH